MELKGHWRYEWHGLYYVNPFNGIESHVSPRDAELDNRGRIHSMELKAAAQAPAEPELPEPQNESIQWN